MLGPNFLNGINSLMQGNLPISPELTEPKSFKNRSLIRLPSILTLFNELSRNKSLCFPTQSYPSSPGSVSQKEVTNSPLTCSSPQINSGPSIKAKRKRANQEQIQTLNKVFIATPFPSTETRLELGNKVGMTPRAVQIWFQNKRQALKGQLYPDISQKQRRGSYDAFHFDQDRMENQRIPHYINGPLELKN